MGRRINGEGTIYWDASKARWIGAITIDGRRVKVVGKTREVAAKRLSERRLESQAGLGAIDGNATLSDAIDRWTGRALDARPLAPSTRANYRWIASLWRLELGRKRLRLLTPDDVERVLDKLASPKRPNAKPLGYSGLIKMRSVLGMILDYAMRRGMANRNVARIADITPTALRTPRRTALTPELAGALWPVLEQQRLGPMFALAMVTGLRPGEAAGVLWDDLDLETDTITVRHAIRQEAGQPTVVDALKTLGSYRTIAIPEPLAALLRRHRYQQAEERIAARAWADPRLVFATRVGTPLDAANRRRELRNVCLAAGVPPLRPNELRHTAATLMADAGVSLDDIAGALGHANTRMLEATYRHRLRPATTAPAAAMAAVLAETS